eukprot:SAG11_NODE_2958_length_2809_cov_4.732841_2_plen_177_part_00
MTCPRLSLSCFTVRKRSCVPNRGRRAPTAGRAAAAHSRVGEGEARAVDNLVLRRRRRRFGTVNRFRLRRVLEAFAPPSVLQARKEECSRLHRLNRRRSRGRRGHPHLLGADEADVVVPAVGAGSYPRPLDRVGRRGRGWLDGHARARFLPAALFEAVLRTAGVCQLAASHSDSFCS